MAHQEADHGLKALPMAKPAGLASTRPEDLRAGCPCTFAIKRPIRRRPARRGARCLWCRPGSDASARAAAFGHHKANRCLIACVLDGPCGLAVSHERERDGFDTTLSDQVIDAS